MLKEEYLNQLREKLGQSNIPGIDGMIEFYDEAINDRIEDGMSEEDAVAAMEDADQIVKNAKLDKPITTLMADAAREKHKEASEKGHGALFVVLAIVGFPIWFPLLIAFFSVIFSLYIALWAVVVSIYAVEFSLAVSAVAAFVAGFGFFFGQIPFISMMFLWGGALVCAGLTILLWKPIVFMSKGMIKIIKEIFRSIKKIFVR